MKLFAIATTATVSGRLSGRVDQPAPGIVNEQGGYWADQTSDQSRHYPQPPQHQWPQEEQPQQKPQCCSGYFWSSPTGEIVWMAQDGENDMKPIYKGLLGNGAEKVLYWAFDEVPDNRPFIAIPGHWYFGSEIGDPNATESKESYTLRHCPTDQESNWGSSLKLECGQNPGNYQFSSPQTQCCPAYKWTTPRDDIVWMRQNGEIHHEKPVYEGVDMGITQIMFWKFDPVSDNRPVEAVPGAWYVSEIGTEDENAVASATLKDGGINSCPDEPKLNWSSIMDLECGHPPPPETCADVQGEERKRMFKLLGAPAPPFKEIQHCNIKLMLESLVKKQLTDLKALFHHTKSPWKMDTYFAKVVNAWRETTSFDWSSGEQKNKCGFENDFRSFNPHSWGSPGFVMNCENMCEDIKKVEKAQDFAAVLDEFLLIIDLNLDKNDTQYKNDAECIKNREKLYTNIANFESFVGKLEHLPDGYSKI